MLKIDAVGSNEREFLDGVFGDFISRRKEKGTADFTVANRSMASIPSISIEAHLCIERPT